MCFSSPKIPPPPAPPQEVKMPETSQLQRGRRQAAGMAGGTLLTGPSGIANLPTGSNTLLGS